LGEGLVGQKAVDLKGDSKSSKRRWLERLVSSGLSHRQPGGVIVVFSKIRWRLGVGKVCSWGGSGGEADGVEFWYLNCTRLCVHSDESSLTLQ
jgi:hypothetical protein